MKYLFIGAHADDVTLSMGGTILKLLKDKNNQVTILVCTKGDYRDKDITTERISRKKVIYPNANIINYNYKDQELDSYSQARFAGVITRTLNKINPDIVFTHCPDINLDHKLVSHAVRVACRKKELTLYFFKTPGTLNSNITLNTFVDITKEFSDKLDNFKKFAEKYPTPDLIEFDALNARYTYNPAGSGYYEGFQLIKGKL